jgi:hypothetical protein
MAYELHRDDPILRVVFTGILTNRDLGRALEELAVIEAERDVVPDRITDIRPVERLEIDFAGVLALAVARRRRVYKYPVRTALIAADTAQIGAARMFQAVSAHPQITVEIFGDDESALKWLRGSGTSRSAGV